MKLSAKKAKRKKKEQKRRKRNLMRQSKYKRCKARLLQKPIHITYSKGQSKKQRGNSNQSKVAVILLGAGAGKAWGGPLSSDIDTIIKEDTRFTSQTDNLPLGSFIFNKLEKFYGLEGCVNFETFLGALEFLVDYIFSKTNEGGSPANTSFTPLLANLSEWINEIKDYKTEDITASPSDVNLYIPRGNEVFNKEERSNIDRIYFSELLKHYYHIAATKIEEYVLNIHEPVNLPLNNALKKYIKHLVDSGYTVRAYTTNYDRLFPEVLRDKFQIFDGFNLKDSDEYGSKVDYNIDKILNDKSCHTYYNLHGCLRWERSFDMPLIGYRFACTPKQTHTTIDFKSMQSANPGHAILPINIVTGYNKVQRTSLEPLNLFYNSFISDCNNAGLLLTAGYSFSDFHINRALSLGVQKPQTKHLHIGYSTNPEAYMQEAEFRAIDDMQRQSEGILKVVPNNVKWLKSDDTKGRRRVYLRGLNDFLIDEEYLVK